MPIRCRCVYVTLVTACLVATAFGTPEAFGQFTSLHAPGNAVRGESINLFAGWSGPERADGFHLRLPAGWSLDSATVVQSGYRGWEATVRRTAGPGFRIEVPDEMGGPHDLIVHLRSDDASATDRLELTPLSRSGRGYVPRPALRAERWLRVVEPSSERTNRVAAFDGRRSQPVHRGGTPDLSADRAYVVSLWMKSAALREVVLSTWNGDERRAYPVEMTVDEAGRLRAFRGRPGEHRSLVSARPVADGAWHHVAFSNDPDGGWAFLVVDGRTVDSLYSAAPPRIDMELPLVLGGRSDGPAPYFDGLSPYSGSVDDLEVVPASGERLLLDFQEPSGLLEGPGTGWHYEFDGLGRRHQVEDFQAIPGPEGVTVTWKADAPRTRAFAVERSYDGRTFSRIERVLPHPSGSYRVLDVEVDDRVVYYLVRQLLEDGSERITGTLRVGLGAERTAPVTLLGNFPNPFNASTTINYEVREASPVHLGVWDLSGQLIAPLVDQSVQPGEYEARFDASDLPSGTYFVRLRTPAATVSHKMILMK